MLKQWKWPVVLLAQLATMLAAGALIALTELLGGVVYAAAAWVGMPAVGLISGYRATRRGLLNYAAWLAPPVGMAVSHWLIWTYPPSAGPVMLCALVSLVGAAAGEVMNQRRK